MYTLWTVFRRFFVSITTVLLTCSSVVPAAWARTPDDTFYSRQWYLTQIGAEQAWDVTTGSRDVVVAVVDTAMDIDHEDLKENIWMNEKEIPNNQLDDDGNGLIDDVHGWNFQNNTNDVRPQDPGAGHRAEQGYVHATLVASLIGARGNNGKGVTGLAWDVRIMPVVALDAEGGGSTTDVARAIRYAANNGAHIINLSLEGYGDAPEVDDAVSYARGRGVLTIAAAGNAPEFEGINVDTTKVFPVCLSGDAAYGLLGVSSTDEFDERAPYANYGSCVQVSAPGNNVFGARPSALASVPGYDGGFSGTSLAVPLVAGTAALIKSLRPDWGWAEIRERIMASSAPIDHLQDAQYRGKIGRGRLDVVAALSGVPRLVVATTSELSATLPGRPTRIRVRTGSKVVEIVPFGATDTRGARAVFTDVNNDGVVEIVAAPASGKVAEWAVFSKEGTVQSRAVLARDVRDGVLIATAGDGFVVADPNGGRAWGVDQKTGAAILFSPYGTAYKAGLDMVSVPGGVAFAPRGGGGHLMVMDRLGNRLVSAFPFGKTARGRWSVARIGDGSATNPISLVMSGPRGSQVLHVNQLGSAGWQPLDLAALEAARPVGSSGRSGGVAGELVYDIRSN